MLCRLFTLFQLTTSADYGVEEAVSIDGIDQSAITQKLKDLVTKGENMPK